MIKKKITIYHIEITLIMTIPIQYDLGRRNHSTRRKGLCYGLQYTVTNVAIP